jgi:hypothetical protein
MRTSLLMRGASASAAVALFLLSGPGAALAHGQMSFGSPAMRSGTGHGHASAPGFRNGIRSSWAWRGSNRGARFGRNGRFWNGAGFYGSGFWYGPHGFADTAGGGAGGLVIVVGAPSFNDFAPAPNEGADPGPQGGCVIHKLTYDSAGKYVGERQTAGC